MNKRLRIRVIGQRGASSVVTINKSNCKARCITFVPIYILYTYKLREEKKKYKEKDKTGRVKRERKPKQREKDKTARVRKEKKKKKSKTESE